MNGKRLSFKEGGWLRTNLKYTAIAIIIGAIISLFNALFNANSFTAKNVMLNILFSLFITLSITNIVSFVQRCFTPSGSGFWKFIILFYTCNLIGLTIGIETSYLLVSLIFDVKYQFLDHSIDYKFTTFITLIIGTLILLFEFQKSNAAALLKAKEMDLIKLNQLKTQVELQALQAKINPHFLYNALNSIVSLIHEDPDKAEDMTMKLSKLFRYSINTMQENFCTIKEEIEILNTYLAIEKVRFGDRINFDINYPPALEYKQIPRFLLQPMVENALKHGLKDVHGNGILEVSVKQNGDKIEFYIYDNGHPFPIELAAGYGMQSTLDKLQLLYKEDYDFQLNNTPQKHIKISVPLT